MRSKYKLLFAVFILAVVFLACGRKGDEIGSSDDGDSVEQLNKLVYVTAPEGWNSYKIGDVVRLAVEVTGSEPVAFSIGGGDSVVLVIQEGDQWIEVKDLMTYPQQLHVYQQKEIGSVNIAPDIENNGKPVNLRIFLLGHLYRDGKVTDEDASAFIELKLQP